MNDHNDVRTMVSEAYTKALELSRAGGGCCGPSSAPCGAAAQTAGYAGELDLHPGAAQASFGCGNPLAFAAVQPGQVVLDLGSGAGFDLLIAADKVGPAGRVIGVDMTDAMIAAARANAARAGRSNVEVRKGLIEELPVADASVDWVISNCVINLSPEKERVFGEIARVLRPGGRFRVSDIVAEGLPAELLSHAAAYAACVAGAISERDYLAGLARAGLSDLRVETRLVYDAEQLRAMAGNDLQAAGWPRDALDALLDRAAGKVASVTISGRRP